MKMAMCHPDRPHYAFGLCRPCYDRSRSRARYLANRPERLAQAKAYYDAHRQAKRTYDIAYRAAHGQERVAQQNAYAARRYVARTGCNLDEVRPFFEDDDKICWLCGRDGGTDLDHDHLTLRVRGWAHGGCNRIEGLVMSSPDPVRLLVTLAAVAAFREADA